MTGALGLSLVGRERELGLIGDLLGSSAAFPPEQQSGQVEGRWDRHSVTVGFAEVREDDLERLMGRADDARLQMRQAR